MKLQVCLVLVLVSAGCADTTIRETTVARVGDAVLTQSQLDELWTDRMVRSDSATVAQAIVDQWVVNELLYQEALRRELHTDSLLQQQIEDNRRSLLIARLLEELYAEDAMAPDPAAVETWYQQHRASLVLRQPYVRIWYLPVDSASWTSAIVDELARAETDSAFSRLIDTYSVQKEQSRYFASGLLPLSLVFSQYASMRERVGQLTEGDILPPLSDDGLVHVMKLVERVPAGTIPDLDMIRSEIEQRILIESRKQLFARQVQRLRTAAEARDDLFARE